MRESNKIKTLGKSRLTSLRFQDKALATGGESRETRAPGWTCIKVYGHRALLSAGARKSRVWRCRSVLLSGRGRGAEHGSRGNLQTFQVETSLCKGFRTSLGVFSSSPSETQRTDETLREAGG